MNANTYALRAANGMIASMAHYGNHSPACSDGRVSTPAYYANMMGKAMRMLGVSELPGDELTWWGDRWLALAEKWSVELV